MELKVIKRNGNAVVPDGMFKLCGMENAKLISMVQLNGGILLMPESVSTASVRIVSSRLRSSPISRCIFDRYGYSLAHIDIHNNMRYLHLSQDLRFRTHDMIFPLPFHRTLSL